MKDSESVLEADLLYAVKMVREGYATAEQAAGTCGVRLSDLYECLAAVARRKESGRSQPCQTP